MKKALVLLCTTSMLFACHNKQQTNSTTQADSIEVSIKSAPFEVDSAYSYIKQQVAFGVRTPGSLAHTTCGDWIESKLKSWGFQVSVQKFPGKEYNGKAIQGHNIIASLNPEQENRLLFMAHWDTRPVADEDPDSSLRDKPIDGADDGASGVAVLLELARQWSLNSPNIGIDIIFFDLEDGGTSGNNDSWCLGSQYWANNPHKSGYTAKGGILLDMVGARNAKFHWESYSKTYAAPLLRELWNTAKDLGHINYFPQSEGGAMVDDHIPVIEKLGIPCVDIINYSVDNGRQGFGEHWHTQQDNINIIDKSTLQAVGQTVATFVQNYK